MTDFQNLDPREFIIIKGAKVNNLKSLDVAIPRNKLIVVTGLSGSGKSSLAFDTLFAEGQRMYVESLSSYARQFLGRLEKPEVEYIKGVAPAIAIEQKVNTRNSRSTVGTSTEIYDYLKLLYARIGITISPVSGAPVQRHSVTDVVEFIVDKGNEKPVYICCRFRAKSKRTFNQQLELLLQQGFTRLFRNNQLLEIEDLLKSGDLEAEEDTFVLIDRLKVRIDDQLETLKFRLGDSIQTAFFEGNGNCSVFVDGQLFDFSDKFELDGMEFEIPSVNLFTFNNPYGACKTCDGFGKVLGIDPDMVIPDKNLSLYEGAVAPWRSPKMGKWQKEWLKKAEKMDFPIHRPYKELTESQRELLWKGSQQVEGVDDFFEFVNAQKHKIQYRVLLSRYRGRTICPDCKNTRLRKDASYVKIQGKSIMELVLLPIDELAVFFKGLKLNESQAKIAKRILSEIQNRIEYLLQVGLSYLTLNRLTATLSGGEFQRIKLSTSLGSSLVGSMYILDEPSIGLHPKDTSRLSEVLDQLKALGNTVIVVEHEEAIMKQADQIIDIGPDAGSHGGNLIFQGTMDEILKCKEGYTGKYLSGEMKIALPTSRREWKDAVEIKGAYENNLNFIDIKIPLNVLVAITGVSGSGKSTLVKKILYPAIGKILGTVALPTGKFSGLEGDYAQIKQIEFVDQNPIGKSSRSNPVTYIKAYDSIRTLFSVQPYAKSRNLKPSHFSFNVDGGRCDECKGEGIVKVEMQFMADIELECESCKGRRFKNETLGVKYKDKSISDVLNMTVEECVDFFKDEPKIQAKLQPLLDVGLGYIGLGQSSNSLSGGEAQRVKLAYFLSKGGSSSEKIMFIFDEPTTGLHFHDIHKLLKAINALIERGNSVVIIEHNMDVVKTADWVIDLGPEGGKNGGQLVFEGTPEELVKLSDGHTARYLKEKLLV